jgi:hypothetical protein
MTIEQINNHIWGQFNDPTAQAELREMSALSGIDWVQKTRDTLTVLLPRLPALSRGIKTQVANQLNAPLIVQQRLGEIQELHKKAGVPHVEGVEPLYADAILSAEWSAVYVENITSQQVSAAIQRFILSINGLGALVQSNGNSVYPDLILNNKPHYASLPKSNRTTPVDGPSLRGGMPSNVPDGCEIKTNDGDVIKVDAHGDHPGLHLGVTWSCNPDSGMVINGVWGAYIRRADYKHCGRNVASTTVKYSFGHNLFIAL